MCDAHHIALNCFRASLFHTCRSGGPAIFCSLRRQPFGSIILIQGLADDSLGHDQSYGHFCNGFGRRFRPLTLVAAQESATDVGFVEAMSGRVVAFVRGSPVLVDVLDVISERTRLDLLANSELRLCHYRIGRFVTMRGPARITVSADGITVQAGNPVDVSHETCAVIQASKFQGGLVARGVAFKK